MDLGVLLDYQAHLASGSIPVPIPHVTYRLDDFPSASEEEVWIESMVAYDEPRLDIVPYTVVLQNVCDS